MTAAGGASVDWGSLTVDGAFIVGAIAGAAMVLHLTRSIMGRIRRDDDRRPPRE